MAIPWDGIVSRPIDDLDREKDDDETTHLASRESSFSERMIALHASQGVRARYGIHLAWEHRGIVDRLLR